MSDRPGDTESAQFPTSGVGNLALHVLFGLRRLFGAFCELVHHKSPDNDRRTDAEG